MVMILWLIDELENTFSMGIYEQGLYPEHGSCGRSTKAGQGQTGDVDVAVLRSPFKKSLLERGNASTVLS